MKTSSPSPGIILEDNDESALSSQVSPCREGFFPAPFEQYQGRAMDDDEKTLDRTSKELLQVYVNFQIEIAFGDSAAEILRTPGG